MQGRHDRDLVDHIRPAVEKSFHVTIAPFFTVPLEKKKERKKKLNKRGFGMAPEVLWS